MADNPAGFVEESDVPEGFLSDEDVVKTGVQLPLIATGEAMRMINAGAAATPPPIPPRGTDLASMGFAPAGVNPIALPEVPLRQAIEAPVVYGGKLAAGLGRSLRDVLSPTSYLPEEEQARLRPFVIGREEIRPQTAAEVEQRDAIRPGVPLLPIRRTQLQPEGSDAERMLAGLTTPESIVMLGAGGASKLAGAAFLATMAPGILEDVQRVAGSEATPEEKRDRINGLILPVILAVRGAKPNMRGAPDYRNEMAPPQPLEFSGAAIPGRPRGATPIIPTAGPEVLGPQVPRRLRTPGVVVPETLPEPQRDVPIIREIRDKDARTKEQIQKLFPQLTREEAGELRRQAWGTAGDFGVEVAPKVPRPSPMPPLTPRAPAPEPAAPVIEENPIQAEANRQQQAYRSGLEQQIIFWERQLDTATKRNDPRAQEEAKAKLLQYRQQYEGIPPVKTITPKPPIARAPGSAFRPEVPGTAAEPYEDVATTIRRKNIRTREALLDEFPGMRQIPGARERAGQLLRQVWGTEPPGTGTPPPPPGEPPPSAPPAGPVPPVPPTSGRTASQIEQGEAILRQLEQPTAEEAIQGSVQPGGLPAKGTEAPPLPESARARLQARVKRNVEEGVLGPEAAPPVAPTPKPVVPDLETPATFDKSGSLATEGPIGKLRDQAIRELGLKNWARWSNFSKENDQAIKAKMVEIARRHPRFEQLFEERPDGVYERATGNKLQGPREANTPKATPEPPPAAPEVPPEAPEPVQPPPQPATIEETPIAGKTLAEWEAVKSAADLPRGTARAELAKWLAVPNQPSRILQALGNKKRTREIHAPPATEVAPVQTAVETSVVPSTLERSSVAEGQQPPPQTAPQEGQAWFVPWADGRARAWFKTKDAADEFYRQKLAEHDVDGPPEIGDAPQGVKYADHKYSPHGVTAAQPEPVSEVSKSSAGSPVWKVSYVDLQARSTRRPFYNQTAMSQGATRQEAIDRVKARFGPPQYGEFRASKATEGTKAETWYEAPPAAAAPVTPPEPPATPEGAKEIEQNYQSYLAAIDDVQDKSQTKGQRDTAYKVAQNRLKIAQDALNKYAQTHGMEAAQKLRNDMDWPDLVDPAEAAPAAHPVAALFDDLGITGKPVISDDGKSLTTPWITRQQHMDLEVAADKIGWIGKGIADEKGSKVKAMYGPKATANEQAIQQRLSRIGRLELIAEMDPARANIAQAEIAKLNAEIAKLRAGEPVEPEAAAPAEAPPAGQSQILGHWRSEVEPALHDFFQAFNAFGAERLERNGVKPPGISASEWLEKVTSQQPVWGKGGRKTGNTGIQMLSQKDLWPTQGPEGESLRKSMLAAVKALKNAPGRRSDWIRNQELSDTQRTGTPEAAAPSAPAAEPSGFVPEAPKPALPETAPGERALAQQIDKAAEAQVTPTASTETVADQKKGFDAKQAKQQKTFLLSEVDNAIAEAPDIPTGAWQTPELEAEFKQANSVNVAPGEKTSPEQLEALFQKYQIPTEVAPSTPYTDIEGKPQQAEKGFTYKPAGRIDLLKLAIEKANFDAAPKVTIDIPGDGTFSIVDSKGSLEAFKERAKKFPTTAPKAKGPEGAGGRTTPTAAPALGKLDQDSAKKAATLFASTDAGRNIINYGYSDGETTVATDGRRLIVIKTGSGGTAKKPALVKLNEKAKALDETDKFPNWKQVIPSEESQTTIFQGLDAARLFNIVQQAKQAIGDKVDALTLYRNPDGSLGMRSSEPAIGEYAHNIKPDAKIVTTLNADYLADIFRAARILGDEKVSLSAEFSGVTGPEAPQTPELNPIVVKGKNFKAVLMPMRGANQSGPTANYLERGDLSRGKPSMGPGAAARAEFEAAAPDPEVLGLDAGNPVYNRLARGLENLAGGLKQLTSRRPQKRDMEQFADAADNIPRIVGQQAGNSIRLRTQNIAEQRAVTALMQALKMSGQGLSQEAAERLGELEFAGDPLGYLRSKKTDLSTIAQQFIHEGKKLEAQAAIDLANAMGLAASRFNQLRPIAELAKKKFDRQLQREAVAGINTDYENWYVPQRHELDLMTSADRPIVLGHSAGSGTATGFKKAKVFEDYATAIENGFVPRSLSIADLLEHRVAQGEKLIARKGFFDSLKSVNDQVDGKPIVMKIPRRVIERPDGSVDVQETVPRGYSRQEVIPGYSVAVHDGYSRLMKALTATSQLSESAAVGTLQDIAAVEKHIGLALDTFHASRTLQAEFMLTGKLSIGDRQRLGRALVEYSGSDLDQAVSRGEISQEMADYIQTPIPMQIGGREVPLSPKAVLNLGIKSGLNIARFADVIYRDWLREVPITGAVNKWVFDKMTRSAIAHGFISEFQRVARQYPEWNAKRVGLNVARDINALFGNLQKESIFRNPSLRAINQIIFLAPQWVESLARREARAALQLGQAGVGLLKGEGFRVRSAGKAVGTGLVSYFVGTQLLNLITRGHLTFSNEEENHKLDAWIPDVTGKTKGFFISPLAVFGEITHDIIRYAQTKPDFATAVAQIGANKLGNLGRAMAVMVSGRDPLSGEKIIGSVRRALAAGTQLAPIPISLSAGARAVGAAAGITSPPPPGGVQRQVTASLGFKTEPVPSAQNQIYSIADRWKSSQGPKLAAQVEQRLKEDFGPSRYKDIRMALQREDLPAARRAYQALRQEGTTPDIIRRTMEHPHPFAGSAALEVRFRNSLTPQQHELYRKALDERKELVRRFREMLRTKE